MSNIVIDIAAEFTGAKGFKQAETSTDKLSKGVKSLAKSFGLAFGTAQVLAFGKASLKAAAEDEKAQKQLALALKNVGLSRDAAASEDFIQKLQSEFGILDDKLRPAYQTLAVATRDTAESQKLLQLALDISASTGKDLGSVTSALSKAYLGNNTALSKLGVGISKADLKAKSFKDITDELAVTFAGSATQSANTFQGSMDKLGVASANVKEIIGKGLIDALKAFGEDDSVSNFAKDMENTALYLADVVRGVGQLISYVKQAGDAAKDIPVLNKVLEAVLSTPFFMPVKFLNQLGSEARHINEAQQTSAQALNHLAELQSKYVVKTLSNKKKLTAEELKALNAAKLKLAIEKANLALNKGEEVFDMDKIQIAAALTNQAKQLGDATNAAQVLQIANDTARLNVKRSILNVEDAIASQDKDAIESALKKLDADLKVLGVLNNQKLTIGEISKLLKTLQAEDLKGTIDFSNNIEDTLNKLLSLYKVQTDAENTLYAIKLRNAKTLADVENDTLDRKLRGYSASALALEALVGIERQAAISKLASDIGSASLIQGIQSGQTPAQAAVGARYAAQAAYNYYIEITAGIGDPNAIAEAVDQVLTAAVQRGTLRGTYAVA